MSGSAGTAQDVGGNNMESNNSLSVHGGRGNDTKLKLDGMGFNSNHLEGGGIMTIYVHNQAAIQEMVLETGGISAESETGGVQLNAVPKEGSNALHAAATGNYSNEHLSGNADLPAAIEARGLTTTPTTKQVWDYQFGFGGPVKRDKLWFFTSHRWWGSQQYGPTNFFNTTPNTMFYTPDLSHHAYTDQPYEDHGGRLTWQVNSKNKITVSENWQHSCDCHSGALGTSAPETHGNWDQGPHWLTQATWSYPATSKLLFEAGASLGYFPINQYNEFETAAGINITELSTGVSYGAPASLTGAGGVGYFLGRDLAGLQRGVSNNYNERLSGSYVTGSHAFKVGLYLKNGLHDQPVWVPNDVNYQFRNGSPVMIVERVSPLSTRERIFNAGLFAQDQWTIRRLTLNLGVRYDGFRGSTLAEHIAPKKFVAPFDVPAVNNIPNWNNITPRLGGAYDVFGNGKTAIKASIGKYVIGHAAGIVDPNHPANSIVTSTTRTWTDTNRNFIPDCDLNVRGINGECGAITNNAFGTSVINTRYADEVLRGWDARDYNWQASAVVQHELRPGFALSAGYFRSWFKNFWVRSNESVTAADFDTYCVTTPADTRLPGGGNQKICGFYDVKPAKFGQVNNLVTRASHYGESIEYFNGIDVGFNRRFLASGLLQGGVSFGQRVTDVCYAAARPNLSPTVGASQAFATAIAPFCRVSPPWSAGTQVKLAGNYPLPGRIDVSATFVNLPGSALSGNMVVTSAQVASSLGRNFSSGAAGTATVQILPSQTYFEDRITQLDLRLTKQARIRKMRVRGLLDIYNVFSERAVLTSNPRLGPSFLQPTAVMAPRLFKFGAQWDW